MEKKRLFLLRAGLQSVVLLLITLLTFSQSKTVTGKVTDPKDNSPLAGVSVQVKGTSIGAVSDENGNFTITAPSNSSTLVFSYSGVGTQEIQVGNQSTINVQLSS